MMEGDPETLEAELNSAMQSGGDEYAEQGQRKGKWQSMPAHLDVPWVLTSRVGCSERSRDRNGWEVGSVFLDRK